MPENEDILFEGKTFEIIKKHYKRYTKTISIEIARRSPGVRLIIVKNKKILLIKEYRYELNDYDYRLPGGKVFDRLDEYKDNLERNVEIGKCAIMAAKKECLEETGIIARKIRLFRKANAGLTVFWDLFYFIVEDFSMNPRGQELEDSEEIYPEWKTFKEIKKLCLNNKIKEYRTVGILLSYLMKK